MATITTPAAGVSPYPAAAAAPVVLRAAADGTTVLADAAAAAATVSELAAANANTLVVVTGPAALNSLITTSQPGVFDGANVTINLEEQNFNTTNQVTSTTNYPSGGTGEIQYNSGANSFASDAYFTYTNSNVVTPGIRTNNYLYANGSPFTGGGNAAIGNFVFTGDAMTIAHANSTLSVTGNGTGNVNISANSNTWTFNADGNLVFPSNLIIDNESPNTRIYQTSGSLKIRATTTASLKLGWDEFTGASASGSLAHVITNGGGSGQPANLVVLTGNSSSTTYQWIFGASGNLTLPNDATISDSSNVASLNAGGNTRFAQLYWNGNIGNGNPYDGSDYYTWAYTSNTGFTIQHKNASTSTDNEWKFGASGNLTLPGNTFAVNYANGNPVSIANTGNVTFSSEIVIGTGTSNLISGLYLAPSSSSANANMYLRVRGNITDEPTHIHFDTGNNAYYNQFIGDDNKYIQLANTGNIVINSNDVAGNAAQWNFGTDGTLSAPGNITGNYFIGNGSQLTSVAVPSQTILPTIQSITVATRPAGLFGGGQGGVTVTVANTIPVTEYGVIITSGTSSQKYATGALGNIPGTVPLTFTTGLNSTQYTLYAYVTSNAGTYYSDAATGTSGICLLAGTQIALSDGTHKAIEDITYTDKLLSWDFDRGCYAETTAMWIKRSETGGQYNLLTFSDGTTLRTFDQHRIFNKQAGAFTYPMTAETPVGTVTVNEHGQEITLTNKQVIQDTIDYYNVITDYHMNLFSDSVLTSCRFNNIYPIVDMKFAKDGRTLRTRAEFENVPDKFFHGLRLAEQTADIETVEWYVNRLLSTEVSSHAELAV